MADQCSATMELLQAKNANLEAKLKSVEAANHNAEILHRSLQHEIEDLRMAHDCILKEKEASEDQRKKAVAEAKELRASLTEMSGKLQAAHWAQVRQRQEIDSLQEEADRLRKTAEDAKSEAQESLRKAHEAEMKLQQSQQLVEELKGQLSEAQAARDLLRQLDEEAKVALEEMSRRPDFCTPEPSSSNAEERPHQDTVRQPIGQEDRQQAGQGDLQPVAQEDRQQAGQEDRQQVGQEVCQEVEQQHSSQQTASGVADMTVSSNGGSHSDILQTSQELRHLVEEMEAYVLRGLERSNADERNKDAQLQAQQQTIEDLQKELKELRELHDNDTTANTAPETSVETSATALLSSSLSRDAREIREMVQQMGSQLSQRLMEREAEANHSTNEGDREALLKAQEQIRTQRKHLFDFIAQQAEVRMSMQQYYRNKLLRLQAAKDELYAHENTKQEVLRRRFLNEISWRDQQLASLQDELAQSQYQTTVYFQSYIHMRSQYLFKSKQFLRSRAGEKYLMTRFAAHGEVQPLPPSSENHPVVSTSSTTIVPKDVPSSSHGVDNASVAQQCTERAEQAAATKAVLCKRLSLKVSSLRVRNARSLRQHALRRDILKRKQRATMKQLKALKTSKTELVRATRHDIDNLQTALAHTKVQLQEAAKQCDWYSEQLSNAVAKVDKQRSALGKIIPLCKQRRRQIEDLQKENKALKAQLGLPQNEEPASDAPADTSAAKTETFDDKLLPEIKKELEDTFIKSTAPTSSAPHPMTEVVVLDDTDDEDGGSNVPSKAESPSKLGKRPREKEPQGPRKRQSS